MVLLVYKFPCFSRLARYLYKSELPKVVIRFPTKNSNILKIVQSNANSLLALLVRVTTTEAPSKAGDNFDNNDNDDETYG